MKPYAVRIPKGLLELAEIESQSERTDKTTVLRQLPYAGAERYVLRLIAPGRVSMGRAAKPLAISTHDIQRLAQEHGIELGPTQGQYRQASADARKLKRGTETTPGSGCSRASSPAKEQR
jgi:hypothetical protein